MDGNKMYRIAVGSESMNVGISEESIAKIAAIAAVETDGVSCLAGNITRDIVAKLSRKKLVSGVSVSVADKKASIVIRIVVKYGYEIPLVAANVIDKITAMIETMTGFEVESLKIRIANIDADNS